VDADHGRGPRTRTPALCICISSNYSIVLYLTMWYAPQDIVLRIYYILYNALPACRPPTKSRVTRYPISYILISYILHPTSYILHHGIFQSSSSTILEDMPPLAPDLSFCGEANLYVKAAVPDDEPVLLLRIDMPSLVTETTTM
jgi:hypothetical protein